MKLYRGLHKDDSERNVLVTDVAKKDKYWLPLYLNLHNHSPTGFAWGYGGSGPHQLALALIADATDGNGKLALEIYHTFVHDYVSGWSMDQDFEITQKEILDWIAKQGEKKDVNQ